MRNRVRYRRAKPKSTAADKKERRFGKKKRRRRRGGEEEEEKKRARRRKEGRRMAGSRGFVSLSDLSLPRRSATPPLDPGVLPSQGVPSLSSLSLSAASASHSRFRRAESITRPTLSRLLLLASRRELFSVFFTRDLFFFSSSVTRGIFFVPLVGKSHLFFFSFLSRPYRLPTMCSLYRTVGCIIFQISSRRCFTFVRLKKLSFSQQLAVFVRLLLKIFFFFFLFDLFVGVSMSGTKNKKKKRADETRRIRIMCISDYFKNRIFANFFFFRPCELNFVK